MQITTALISSVLVAIAGFVIVWSNPSRLVNRAVFTCSLHIAIWLVALHFAVTVHEGLFLLRLTTAIGALTPLHFWIVKEIIMTGARGSGWRWRWANLAWVILPMGLAAICFTDFFIPSASTGVRRLFGPGYYIVSLGVLALYVFLFVLSFAEGRRLSGGRRLEMQVWLGGGCAMAVAILLLMILSMATHDSGYIRLQPLVVLLFYGGTTFAITTHRIFEARQIFRFAVERFLLVATVTVAGLGFYTGFSRFLPIPIAVFATTAAALWLASVVSQWLDRKLEFFPQATRARQAAFDAARRETRVEGLEEAFLGILKGWGQADHALVLYGGNGTLRGIGQELAGDDAAVRALHQIRWITPERLSREKRTPERVVLAEFLASNRLGVAVANEGPAPNLVVGVGVAMSRQPTTYPDVTQLMELASIMEGAFARVDLSAKAQQAEQLATVGLLGASFAHEIRNPLVSIKTFVQLLPKHYHEAAFRDKFFQLIGDEVTRIDRLTEQLLDLAAPRTYQPSLVELHPILRSSLDLAAAKASDRRVRIIPEFQASPDLVYTDTAAAKQVMLNLCFNAIQAVEGRSGDRWVIVATRNLPNAVELTVSDNGPGISAEVRRRLFQPFQTTKSTGFGLGLAICIDILASLSATLTVDPPTPGMGATFRVHFPCRPSSS